MSSSSQSKQGAWSDAHAGAPEVQLTNTALRESCVKLCEAALKKEWEWAMLLKKEPIRRQRCFSSKNLTLQDV